MPAQGMVQGRGPPCPVQSGRLEKSSYQHGEMEAASALSVLAPETPISCLLLSLQMSLQDPGGSLLLPPSSLISQRNPSKPQM